MSSEIILEYKLCINVELWKLIDVNIVLNDDIKVYNEILIDILFILVLFCIFLLWISLYIKFGWIKVVKEFYVIEWVMCWKWM